MRRFIYNFSITLKILLWSALLVCIAGLCWNIFNLVEYLNMGIFKIITYSLMIVLNLFLIIFVLSIIVSSHYEITQDYLICKFGFLTSKCKLVDIIQIIYYTDKNTLVVYFSNERYTIITIKQQDYQSFTDFLLEKNNKIYYQIERDLDKLEK